MPVYCEKGLSATINGKKSTYYSFRNEKVYGWGEKKTWNETSCFMKTIKFRD